MSNFSTTDITREEAFAFLTNLFLTQPEILTRLLEESMGKKNLVQLLSEKWIGWCKNWHGEGAPDCLKIPIFDGPGARDPLPASAAAAPAIFGKKHGKQLKEALGNLAPVGFRTAEEMAREIFDVYDWGKLYKQSRKVAHLPKMYQAIPVNRQLLTQYGVEPEGKPLHITVDFNGAPASEIHLVRVTGKGQRIGKGGEVTHKWLTVSYGEKVGHITTFVGPKNKAGEIHKFTEKTKGVAVEAVAAVEAAPFLGLEQMLRKDGEPIVAVYDLDETLVPHIHEVNEKYATKNDHLALQIPEALAEVIPNEVIQTLAAGGTVDEERYLVLRRLIAAVNSSDGFLRVATSRHEKEKGTQEKLQTVLQAAVDKILPGVEVKFSMQKKPIKSGDVKRRQGMDKVVRATRMADGATLLFFDDNEKTIPGIIERSEPDPSWKHQGTEPTMAFHVTRDRAVFVPPGTGEKLPVFTVVAGIGMGKSTVIRALIQMIVDETPFTREDINSESTDDIMKAAKVAGKWGGNPYDIAAGRMRENRIGFIDTTCSSGAPPWFKKENFFVLTPGRYVMEALLLSAFRVIGRTGHMIDLDGARADLPEEVSGLLSALAKPVEIIGAPAPPGEDPGQTLIDLVKELAPNGSDTEIAKMKAWFENKRHTCTVQSDPGGVYWVGIHYMEHGKTHHMRWGVEARGLGLLFIPGIGWEIFSTGLPLTIEGALVPDMKTEDDPSAAKKLLPEHAADYELAAGDGFPKDGSMAFVINKPDGQNGRFVVHSTETPVGKIARERALKHPYLKHVNPGPGLAVSVTSRGPTHSNDESWWQRLVTGISFEMERIGLSPVGTKEVHPTKEMTLEEAIAFYVNPYLVEAIIPFINRRGGVGEKGVTLFFEVGTPNAATVWEPTPLGGLAKHYDEGFCLYLGMTRHDDGASGFESSCLHAEVANNGDGCPPLTTPCFIATHNPKEVHNAYEEAFLMASSEAELEEIMLALDKKYGLQGPKHHMNQRHFEGWICVTPTGFIIKMKHSVYYVHHVNGVSGLPEHKLADIARWAEAAPYIAQWFPASREYVEVKKLDPEPVRAAVVETWKKVTEMYKDGVFNDKIPPEALATMAKCPENKLHKRLLVQPGAASTDKEKGAGGRYLIAHLINHAEGVPELERLVNAFHGYGKKGQVAVTRIVLYMLDARPGLTLETIKEFSRRSHKEFQREVHGDVINVLTSWK